jgi:hypothetical protein
MSGSDASRFPQRCSPAANCVAVDPSASLENGVAVVSSRRVLDSCLKEEARRTRAHGGPSNVHSITEPQPRSQPAGKPGH